MNQRRVRVVALLGALRGLLGPDVSALAQDRNADRAHHARRSRRRSRTERTPTSGSQDDEEDVESEPESEAPVRPSPAASSRANDEEVFNDPELRNGPPTPTSRRTDEGTDEVFNDPELEDSRGAGGNRVRDDNNGWGDVYQGPRENAPPAVREEDEHDPMANTGVSRLVLYGQQGIDTHHEGNLEDAYETRLRFDAEVEFRRSRRVRMAIGVRTDLLWALPAGSDADLKAMNSTALKQSRWELDILPISAYVDVTPANGFHVRIGEQQVSVARMDFYSPIDILAAFDMRGQIGLGQSTGKLAQPAIRTDWDISSWATLEVVYLPWFMPNLVRPNRDRYVSRELGTSGASTNPQVNQSIAPGFQTYGNGEAIRFIGPQPDFKNPQAQARLNMRGSKFELAVSGGTALDKIPSIYMTPQFEKYVQGGDPLALQHIFANGTKEFDAEYHRYATFGLDGSFDLAPLTVGLEAAFSPSRHLAAAATQVMASKMGAGFMATNLPLPNVSQAISDNTVKDGAITSASNVTDKRIRKGVPLVQAALHVDYLKGETFAIAAEAFFIQALKLPYDRTRDWWGFIPNKGLYAGGIFGATYRPDPGEGRWKFDASFVAVVGPSFIIMPQVEYKLLDTLYVNVGAQFFEGPVPEKGGQPITGGIQSLGVGGLFGGYDQVYAGFRYVP